MGVVLATLLAGCVQYRSYPILQMDLPRAPPIEPTGVALLPDGRLVVAMEGDARALLVPDPDRPVRGSDVVGVFPMSDDGVQVRAEPIFWKAVDRRVDTPWNVEDLAPFGPDRVLGVTEYTTIGRRTGYRKDYIARPRRKTERLFVLQRTPSGWEEVRLPEVERLRELLSDWGRATCGDDMLVEGLAWDPSGERVFVGLRRCDGPVARVLSYDLGAARSGRAADLQVLADDVAGAVPRGPEEGVSGLCWAEGRLWAVTAWDSFGYATEPEFGGRLHEVRGGALHPVDLPTPFVDRPSGLAVLSAAQGLDAVVLFDNDASAGSRPNATLLQTRTPRPAEDRFVQLLSLTSEPDPLPLGLNGFDFRWWLRDHRLGQLAAVLAGRGTERGAWSRALGGRWQIQAGGSIGLWARGVPVLRDHLGVNKQAVAFTDYGAAQGVTFTRYRAALTVIPRDRERQNPRVSQLLDVVRPAYRVTVPLPVAPSPEAGVVLQGFEIDTSSRADKGLCVAAIELGASTSETPGAVDLQATLIGGLCNDFDVRGPDYHHGTTTAVDGGVRVVLHFAVVEGAASEPWSLTVFDRDVPAPRAPDGSYTRPPAQTMDDRRSRAHLHCVDVDADAAVRVLPRQPGAPPTEWLDLRTRVDGVLTGGAASLRGFALALDPAGFDPERSDRPLTEDEALSRNNYIYRYLLRVFPDGQGAFVEGGISHGIHPRGVLRDNARPSALLLRADMTAFPTLGDVAVPQDIVWDRRVDDPNLLPEDGFLRWTRARRASEEPRCSPSW
ncbi:MAG: hypothetical protein ACOZNI_12840 [Myxococcota bacterium]